MDIRHLRDFLALAEALTALRPCRRARPHRPVAAVAPRAMSRIKGLDAAGSGIGQASVHSACRSDSDSSRI
ncbi:hypothetical protein [Bordetella ansorpii]|uniref:hypothetical protein n=1 Tax=Bordetella ansorpii TaxID=288768 RepID=UPI0012E734A4|nr:hypothetical protein [Bordetella ansorpii]